MTESELKNCFKDDGVEGIVCLLRIYVDKYPPPSNPNRKIQVKLTRFTNAIKEFQFSVGTTPDGRPIWPKKWTKIKA